MNKPEQEFLDACKSGNVQLVRQYLSRGANPRMSDDLALLCAVIGGNLELVKLLLEECELNPDALDGAPIRHAAAKGAIEIIHALVVSGADVRTRGSQSLNWAAIHGHTEVMKYLMESGACKETLTDKTIAAACARGAEKAIQYMVEELGVDANGNDESPLRHAVIENNSRLVHYLLTKGRANVHFDNEFSLLHAVRKGYTEVLAHLIAAGGDAQVNNNDPLMTAVANDNLEIVKILVGKGRADVKSINADTLKNIGNTKLKSYLERKQKLSSC